MCSAKLDNSFTAMLDYRKGLYKERDATGVERCDWSKGKQMEDTNRCVRKRDRHIRFDE